MNQDPRAAAGIVHLALLGGQLVLVVVALVIERSVMPPEGLSADLLLTITIVVALSMLVGSYVAGRALLKHARAQKDEASRMTAGLRAFIVRSAMLEAGGLAALLSYLLTGEITFLGIFAVVFAGFVLSKPSESEWESVEKGDPSAPVVM